MTSCTVRFFAGAAEAAGTQTTTIELPTGATVADVVATLGADNQRLAEVLSVCTLLLDQRPAEPSTVLSVGQVTIDVLPPFAGG